MTGHFIIIILQTRTKLFSLEAFFQPEMCEMSFGGRGLPGPASGA